MYGGRYKGPQPTGNCDVNGKNEIDVGSVLVEHGQDFMSSVFKHGLEPSISEDHSLN